MTGSGIILIASLLNPILSKSVLLSTTLGLENVLSTLTSNKINISFIKVSSKPEFITIAVFELFNLYHLFVLFFNSLCTLVAIVSIYFISLFLFPFGTAQFSFISNLEYNAKQNLLLFSACAISLCSSLPAVCSSL